MRTYLSTLHEKSDSHKKRFALLVSGGATMIIFTIWSLVNFGNGGVLAQNENDLVNSESKRVATVSEVSPLESIGASVSSSFAALGEAWDTLKDGMDELGDFDINASYEEMKERSINTYGGGQ